MVSPCLQSVSPTNVGPHDNKDGRRVWFTTAIVPPVGQTGRCPALQDLIMMLPPRLGCPMSRKTPKYGKSRSISSFSRRFGHNEIVAGHRLSTFYISRDRRMTNNDAGHRVPWKLLTLAAGVLVMLMMLACSDSSGDPGASQAPPPGMFSTQPTSEPPIVGDRLTIELNLDTPEPTFTPEPTLTPNPTFTLEPAPTDTPNPTATPRPTDTPTHAPTAQPNPTTGSTFSCSQDSNPIFRAVKNGDIELTTLLISLCPEHLNTKVSTGFYKEDTPLSFAVKAQAPEMVRILLNAGADPNTITQDQDGLYLYETPLSLAVQARDAEMVRILLDAGADPNKSTQRAFRLKLSPLDIAIEEGYTEMVKLLTGTSNDATTESVDAPGTPTPEPTAMPTPRSPENLRVSQEGSSLQVAWNSVPGATHYRVYHQEGRLGCRHSRRTCDRLDGNVVGTAYTHTDLIPGEPYAVKVVDRASDALTIDWRDYGFNHYYWVTACNDAGCSVLDDDFAASYEVPGYYQIYRTTQGETTQEIRYTPVSSIPNPSRYVERGLQPSAIYYYEVKACNDNGCSAASDETGGLTEFDGPVDVPSTPTKFRGEKTDFSGGGDGARLTWRAVEGATYYEVYQGSSFDVEISAPQTGQPHSNLMEGNHDQPLG